MRLQGFVIKLFSVGILIMLPLVVLFIVNSADATTGSDNYAILLVSDVNGDDTVEDQKSVDLYNYLLEEGYSDESILVLNNQELTINDYESRLEYIEISFSYVISNSNSGSDVVVYISDFAKETQNGPVFQFIDGDLEMSTIDGWIDDISCDELTVIIGGKNSGIAGPALAEQNRLVMSSMKATQSYSPDGFDIARSLNDPLADSDEDGSVSFLEAFEYEKSSLTTGQVPCLWE